MTEKEFIQKRKARWRLKQELAPNDEREIITFIKTVGFCYSYHTPKDTIPSLIQTIAGCAEIPPKHIYNSVDPFNLIINETFKKYYRYRLIAETNAFGKRPVIIHREIFLRLYRLTGIKKSRDCLSQRKRNNKFESAIISYLNSNGPATRKEIGTALIIPNSSQRQKLNDSLESLGRQFKIIRLRNAGREGVIWTTPEKWSLKLCSAANKIDKTEAVEYLINKALNTAVASSRKGIKKLFRYCIPCEVLDASINSMMQRGLILVDNNLVIDGKKALIPRVR